MRPKVKPSLAGVFLASTLLASGVGSAHASMIAVDPVNAAGIASPFQAIAILDTPGTFGDPDAWQVSNETPFRITRIVFSSNGVNPNTGLSWTEFDPEQGSSEFQINPLSDPTGVTAAFSDIANPDSVAAGARPLFSTLSLDFSNFDPGERLIFQLDTDGLATGDSFAGRMNLTVDFVGRLGGTDAFKLFGLGRPNAAIAAIRPVPIPEPLTFGVFLVGLAGLSLAVRMREPAKPS